MPPPLILASSSASRRTQLMRLGLQFECVGSGVDEADLKSRRWPVQALARRLAVAKAEAVRQRCPGTVVVGGDQIASLDGEPFDKPADLHTARIQLGQLSGRTHELATAVAIVHDGGVMSWVEQIRMTMRPLTDAEIESYLRADQPFECAGSYRWEARGAALFSSVETRDPTAILGLPLLRLSSVLRSLGYALP